MNLFTIPIAALCIPTNALLATIFLHPACISAARGLTCCVVENARGWFKLRSVNLPVTRAGEVKRGAADKRPYEESGGNAAEDVDYMGEQVS